RMNRTIIQISKKVYMKKNFFKLFFEIGQIPAGIPLKSVEKNFDGLINFLLLQPLTVLMN
ncbi:MAG: hypothetical protein ACXVBN_11720, partial [Flavisolibacter sp.]